MVHCSKARDWAYAARVILIEQRTDCQSKLYSNDPGPLRSGGQHAFLKRLQVE